MSLVNAFEEDIPNAESVQPDATLRSRTQRMLRDAILDGHYAAGQKLVERELCDLTGASRSILREALVNLEVNGLIERESYRGYTVSQLNARQVDEIFELRELLETRAAELFTERASDSEISDLRAAFADLEACLLKFEPEKMRATKERYYEVLFGACRNSEIRRALANVIDRVFYLRSRSMTDQSRRDASLEEFRRLTNALVERDRPAARNACLAHLRAARDAAYDSIAK